MQPGADHLAVEDAGDLETTVALARREDRPPAHRNEDDQAHHREAEVGDPPRPARRDRGTDQQGEGHADRTRHRVDGGERSRPVLAVVVADDAGHQHHQQGPADAAHHRAGQRDRPRRTEDEDRDADTDEADGDDHCRAPAHPVDRPHAEHAADQQADAERAAVQGGHHPGQAELLAQFAEDDADAEGADEHRIADGRGVGQAVPTEAGGCDLGGGEHRFEFRSGRRRCHGGFRLSRRGGCPPGCRPRWCG